MYLSLLAEILLAVFAVFGLYAVIRLFVTSQLSRVAVMLTVIIGEGTEADDLPQLLDRARERLPLSGTAELAALVDPALAQNEALLSRLRAEGVRYYFGK